MSKRETNQPDSEAVRAALRKARAAIEEALELLEGDEQPAEAVPSAMRFSAPLLSLASVPGSEPAMSLEDLDGPVLDEVIQSLPEVFDTYHVVEHPAFRAAHAELLERPAINQLTGKALRRLAPMLGIAYIGQRGRRRSALWQRQRVGRSVR